MQIVERIIAGEFGILWIGLPILLLTFIVPMTLLRRKKNMLMPLPKKKAPSENRLAEANETLEQRVHDRTQELTLLNAELRRAQEKAETANSDKTKFLAAASHDLLQPLNAARLYTSTLVERTQGGENGVLALNIDASLNAVEDILSSLLDISKLDAGALPIHIAPVNVGDLFEEIGIKFLPLAAEKNLTLTIVPSSVYINSDRALLGRALQNLVSNAVKYTPPGGRILIGCRRRRTMARLDVYDTGIGIPAQEHGEIFGEFTRLDNGARLAPGLGLGLSIVQRILISLGHKLDFVSSENMGSLFSINLPRAVVMEPLAQREVNPNIQRTKLTGLKVLCIDNERQILAGMTSLLEGWQCEIKTATSLRDLVERKIIDGWLPDIVLMDYHLDQTSGIDAIAWLRQNCGGNLPAVLVTADRSTSVRDQAKSNNITILHKPVKPAALRAILSRHAQSSSG